MNWPYLSTGTRIWIIVMAIWWHIGLAFLIYGIYMLNTGAEYLWTVSGFCAIPIVLPLGRFAIRCARGGYRSGSQIWDVEITSYGRVYAHHNGLWYSVIALIIGIILALVASPFILGFYLIYYLILILIALFGRRR